ncbi:repeat, subgroup [Candidatus Thiomargarita nelsonii]|uniref:Repeat, subgroup n=1 Tax=Candidatus Thiomargarita nelsonii TaxID=1003181 RepID=A0A0A6P0E8_9GAMM|nr:repeat, subgroup [Candidatus Thiomargarita nelsonii]
MKKKPYFARQAKTVGRRAEVIAPQTKLLPANLAFLPTALSQLHRLQCYPPLSLVRDLLQLLKKGEHKDDTPLKPLLAQKGIQALRELHWPMTARTGLLALLLRDIPLHDDWAPPPELTPAHVRERLTTVLAGKTIAPKAPPPPLAALQQAAEPIDDRLLSLLTLLGAEAVAADPGLPLRLAQRAPQLPPLSQHQRRLLGMSLRLETGSRAQGSGIGTEHAGVTLHGNLSALLPSQLALPQPVFHCRHLRRELLYRARIGQHPPRLRSTIIVLDITPPCFGPIETLTRLAAHIIATSLWQAQLPVVLVTTDDIGSVHPLEQPADLVEIWAQRNLKPANINRTLSAARAMRETLHEAYVEPVIVLLTHTWFAVEKNISPPTGLRALFVQYPKQQIRPPFAKHCERWESVMAGKSAGLGEILGRLVG